MKLLHLWFFFVCAFMATSLQSQDTFSIIAADPETGEIGAAGATCVDGIAQFGGIQLLNKIIPGRGGVNAQAWVCLNPHINLDLAIQQMELGQSPDEIIDWLLSNDGCNVQNFNPNFRQYGIVDFDENMEVRTAAFSGEQTDDYKGHVAGVNYAIQGNILIGPQVIEGLEEGFNSVEGSLASKLMAAMQGANIPGADVRCLGRGTSSTSAFLRVYKADDDINAPFLNLSILEMPFGEEPIDSLQNLFDAWVLTTQTNDVEEESKVRLFPNPVRDVLTLAFESSINKLQLSVFDSSAKQVLAKNYGSVMDEIIEIDCSSMLNGIYILRLEFAPDDIEEFKFVKY